VVPSSQVIFSVTKLRPGQVTMTRASTMIGMSGDPRRHEDCR
jgi:hypothetical protein